MKAGHWFSHFDIGPNFDFMVYIGYENGDSGIIEASETDYSFDHAFERCMNDIEKQLKEIGVEIL